MSNESININQIVKDSRETLFNPKGFFEGMTLTGGFTEPLIKAAIYGAVSGLIGLLWSVLGMSAVGAGFLGGAVGIMVLIWAIIGAVIGLFIGGVVMLIISAICGGSTDYEANVRVTASLMVMYPINALFAFLSGINLTLGAIVSVVISLYGIYLMYHAVVGALKGKESSAKIVAVVLLVLSLLVFITGRRATRTLQDYNDFFQEEMVD